MTAERILCNQHVLWKSSSWLQRKFRSYNKTIFFILVWHKLLYRKWRSIARLAPRFSSRSPLTLLLNTALYFRADETTSCTVDAKGGGGILNGPIHFFFKIPVSCELSFLVVACSPLCTSFAELVSLMATVARVLYQYQQRNRRPLVWLQNDING